MLPLAVAVAVGSVRSVMLDKTGTLTLGVPQVERVIAIDGVVSEEVLRLAASVDQLSAHVIAEACTTPRPGACVWRCPRMSSSGRAQGIAGQSVLAGMGLSGGHGGGVRGAAAAAGGALLQEGIDVAVILNALRVLPG